MPRASLPVPPPLEGNDRLITVVISAAWAVALIVLLIVRDRLSPADRWWPWVAATGLGIGVFAMFYIPWLKRSRDRAAARQAARESAADASARPPASKDGSQPRPQPDRDES